MIYNAIRELIDYGVKNGLISEYDRVYTTNRVIEALELDEYEDPKQTENRELCCILKEITEYAQDKGLCGNGVVKSDLFDTMIMGLIVSRPGEVIRKFRELYKISPESATDWYYKFSCDSNYIRRDRIIKDKKWKISSEYGDIDITINLSKPEKDPKAIAAAKLKKQSGYPKCALCRENEGYAGTLTSAPRQNHRIIPIRINNSDWFFQYSPYVYYNEHCIVLNSEHTPMAINRSTFIKLLDFVKQFPHYFLGSNADLPIVGGSILTHDHFQGGRYTFAMANAPFERMLAFTGYDDVKAGIVKWPMSCIRLISENTDSLVGLADSILTAWRGYSDPDAFIFAETDGVRHNTITPIARQKEGKYELDLVLRNNITTEEHPLGVFHPHAELHHIKKENIGLIEVMGLAVLPARLKSEMSALAESILKGEDLYKNPLTEKHADWAYDFLKKYENVDTYDKINSIIEKEIGIVFTKVLEDAGVYKCTEEGRKAFIRFADYVNSTL